LAKIDPFLPIFYPVNRAETGRWMGYGNKKPETARPE
jgi:hypothetical protein